MDRMDFVRIGQAAGAQGAIEAQLGAPRFGTGGILDAGLRAQQAMMAAGKLTAHSLTSQYLARIRTLGQAIIEINSAALKIALDMDRERHLRRLRGPLHGIPVLLQDNIATADRMRTTPQPSAPAGVHALRDAHLVARLRAAGAVVIGKTNTANGAGNGAAVAVGLATLALGAEADDNCAVPAAMHGLVGVKPTPGLVSRSGVGVGVGVGAADGMPGPLARCVADAAAMLAAMSGVDAEDEATEAAAGRSSDYYAQLDADGLRGVRIGVLRNGFGVCAERDMVIEKALFDLAAQGAVLFDAELRAGTPDSAAAVEELLRAQHFGALVGASGGGLPSSARHPHVTVPAGYVQDQPVGLALVGPAFGEAALLRMAYAYEQATLHRRSPQMPASVSLARA